MISVFIRSSLVQLNTPDEMRGRVSAISGLAISASNELGEMQSGIAASLGKPRPGAAYNLCDDHPAGADDYTEFAAALIGLPPPPEADWRDDSIGEGMRRFYLDNKRVSNALAKAELGWRPKYADWRDGLRAVLAAEA